MSIHGDHEQIPVSGRPKYATHQDHNDRWCVEVPVDRLAGFSVDETLRQAAAWRIHVDSQRDAQAPEEEYSIIAATAPCRGTPTAARPSNRKDPISMSLNSPHLNPRGEPNKGDLRNTVEGLEFFDGTEWQRVGDGPIADSQNTRRRCLETAQKYTQHDRNETHGTPESNFSNIARYWNAHLHARYPGSIELDATDVALMMAGMKAARLSYNPTHEDSWIDLAGYAACGMEIALDNEHRLP